MENMKDVRRSCGSIFGGSIKNSAYNLNLDVRVKGCTYIGKRGVRIDTLKHPPNFSIHSYPYIERGNISRDVRTCSTNVYTSGGSRRLPPLPPPLGKKKEKREKERKKRRKKGKEEGKRK